MRNLLAFLLFVPGLCLAQLPDYVPLNDLVGWYPFDGDLIDMSGLGNDGSLHGASYGADYSGTPGTALHCAPNGSPGWATLPDNGATESLDFSFSLWFEPEVTSGRSEVLSKDSYPQPSGDWSFFIEDGAFQFETGIDNQPTVFTEGGNTNPGEWHHIVVTRNGSESIISLYVDGEMVSATPESYGPLDSPNLIHVGRHAVLSNVYFQGMINDLGIWNRTLQPTEIQALFLAAPPEYGCTDSTACNFNPLANSNDGYCEYGCLYCGEGTVWDSTLAQCISIAPPCAPSCGEGTVWDPINEECIIAVPTDSDFDGCVTPSDLLNLLATFGTCPPIPEWPDEPNDSGDCPPGAFDQLQQDLNGEGWSWLGEYNTAHYFVSTNPISWDNAQSLAVAYGGHLVVIESQDENDWISTAVGDEYVWIGLYQDTSSVEYSEPAGGWTWVNGAEVTYSNWAGNAPNEVNGLENACQMYSNGLWNDAPGDYFLDGSDGRDIYAVIEFSSACPTPDWSCGDPVTYWDYDYATVLIGDQCWFAENLRTISYANGDPIPSNFSGNDWQWLNTGATSTYGENGSCNHESPIIDACDPSESLAAHGRLYNWYVVDDVRGICPMDWHVPDNEEWDTLISVMGGVQLAVTSLKSPTGWANGENGSNSSGFNGKPGGQRDVPGGAFEKAGARGRWWSTSNFSVYGWTRGFSENSNEVESYAPNMKDGFSIRCVKD